MQGVDANITEADITDSEFFGRLGDAIAKAKMALLAERDGNHVTAIGLFRSTVRACRALAIRSSHFHFSVAPTRHPYVSIADAIRASPHSRGMLERELHIVTEHGSKDRGDTA